MESYDEILMNEKFAEFMTKRDEEITAYWNRYLMQHPENREEFDKAVNLHKALTSHRKYVISDRKKSAAADALLSRIDAYEASGAGTKRLRISPKVAIAASIIAFICLSLPILYLTHILGESEISYNEITVPPGEKSSVQLADGTLIWLNADSKMKYPTTFSRRSREVILEGEGYFDVTKQKGASFTVVTQDIKVVALGTIFNVKSYPDDKVIETTLIEGKVKLQPTGERRKFADIFLSPNQRMIYRKAENLAVVENANSGSGNPVSVSETKPSITITKVNTANVSSWKDHLLIFNNESFEEIAAKMSRWYDVEVIILDDELKQDRYTGKFIHNETAEQVLEVINVTTPIQYRIENKKIYISKKKGSSS